MSTQANLGGLVELQYLDKSICETLHVPLHQKQQNFVDDTKAFAANRIV